ncbi:MAG: PD40 domain-containing protein, partial [Candidatus Riflebacteria bacterium]|nr:PD40 domain-containing protein [Candidatus Riflebacteria bacterium]
MRSVIGSIGRTLVGLCMATAALAAAPVEPIRPDDYLTDTRAKAMHGEIGPDGTRLAAAVERDAVRRIEVVDLKQPSAARPITSGAGIDDFPTWAPDGQSVVFQSTRGATTKLYRVAVSGGPEVPLTFGSGDDLHPRLSRSGRFLAFDSNRSGNYDIWVLELASGKLARVTTDPEPDFYPVWSPNDRALAFTSARSGRFEVWIQPLGRGRQAVRFTSGSGHQAHPDWSTGGWIAYDSDQNGKVRVAALATAQGSQEVSLSGGATNEEFPRFTPDGRAVLAQVTEGERVGLKLRPCPFGPGTVVAPVSPTSVPGTGPATGAVIAEG